MIILLILWWQFKFFVPKESFKKSSLDIGPDIIMGGLSMNNQKRNKLLSAKTRLPP